LYGRETWFLTLKDGHKLRVFENMVLRKIIEPKREAVERSWRTLHNEELHNLKWMGHVACMGRREMLTKFGLENLKGRDHSGDIDIDVKIILELILGNRVGMCGLDSSGSG
jgi:hypothetical protein